MSESLDILGSAQTFGFGAIAEMAAIEGAFQEEFPDRDLNCYLLDDPKLRVVLDGERNSFRLLEPLKERENNLEALLTRDIPSTIDMVVSSYDTAAVFYGWFQHKPTYYYDGMLWFWDFDSYKEEIPALMEQLKEIKSRKDEQALKEFYQKCLERDFHLTVILAYHLADQVYARNATQVPEKLQSFPEFAKKTQIVGSVIDPRFTSQPKDRQDHVLVSLSGSLAPLISLEQNLTFARGALTYALEGFDILSTKTPWYFSCHPKIHSALSGENPKLPEGFNLVPSFPYTQNLDMIRRAHVLIVSPGFSSVQEAACFQTPISFLPEQNGGQPTGFCTLRDAGYPTDTNLTVTHHLYDGEIQIGEYDVDRLYDGISTLWSPEMAGTRRETLQNLDKILTDQTLLSEYVMRQREAVSKIIGGFDGAKKIAQGIKNHFTQQ
ncbi:hypothetical protein KKC94_01300 [Patescibacteria group bacterium]|nr:hypothetical protein [Patescibacteria group bacterium]